MLDIKLVYKTIFFFEKEVTQNMKDTVLSMSHGIPIIFFLKKKKKNNRNHLLLTVSKNNFY